MTDQPMPPPPPSIGLPTTRKPAAVTVAQVLMYIGAGLALLGIVAFMATSGADALSNGSRSTLTVGDVAFIVLGGLVRAGLWASMAWANGAGKTWARITASVLLGIALAQMVVLIARVGIPLSGVVTFIPLILGGVAVTLLWVGKGSNEYFQTMSRR